MNKAFEAKAFFYVENSALFRKYLDLYRRGQTGVSAQVVFVMQNPGDSEPLDSERLEDGEAPARIDDTLKQIVQLLGRIEIDAARIVNLSDIRAANRDDFFRIVKQANSAKISHSIFDESRRDALSDLIPKSIPTVFAWGVDSRVKQLANKAMKTLSISNPHGWKKPGEHWEYYHPLPRDGANRRKWIDVVSSQL